MHLFLVGFMGAGKSTIGRLLARGTERVFFDLDEAIEEAVGRSIPEIFAEDGEAWFRRAEHEALRRLSSGPPAVIATGGGTPAWEGNRRWMAARGLVIWLHPSFQTILGRIGAGKSDRPLFQTETQALELYRSRLDAYRSANLTIDVGETESPDEVAARIRLLLPEESCAT